MEYKWLNCNMNISTTIVLHVRDNNFRAHFQCSAGVVINTSATCLHIVDPFMHGASNYRNGGVDNKGTNVDKYG